MVIKYIKEAAALSNISAVISNSTEKIETQLNRITGIEDLPIMLVNWDLKNSFTFNESNFLNNPIVDITLLLMTKSESREKEDYEEASEEMAGYFQVFIQNLNSILVKINTSGNNAITNIDCTLIPKHGLGKHSGVLCNFTMIGEIKNC